MLISVETRMQERLRHPLAAYGVALVATAASLLVRWPLWPVLGNAVPQMTFFPAVMIAAYFGGFWPGIVATVLSAFAANYFLAEQPSGFHFTKVNDIAAGPFRTGRHDRQCLVRIPPSGPAPSGSRGAATG